MEETKPPAWPDVEAHLLHHEEFMAQLLAKRRPLPSSEASKPRWQRFLESSGGTALITLVLGGLIGGYINNAYQQSQREREFQQAWLKARGDQALVAYQEYLKQEQEIVKRAYELMGNAQSAAEDLTLLTRQEFAPRSFVGAEKQRTEIRDKYNLLDAQWRGERGKLGLLMSYYHQGRAEVMSAWHGAEGALTHYMDCARQWYLTHTATAPADRAGGECTQESDGLTQRLDQLTATLESARQYAWEGWESPEKLRRALGEKK